MADAISLTEAASRYLDSIKQDAHGEIETEVKRFLQWYGESRLLTDLRGHDISRYADYLGPATPEVARRAEHLRAFLGFLKKEKLVSNSLASHLRLRRASSTTIGGGQPREETVELTSEGLAALEAELETLKAQRPLIAEELRHARMDKDFRENAPLDAAREKQAHLEARIREIESRLKRAVVVDNHDRPSHKVHVGSTVVVRNLQNGASVKYTVVNQSEANIAANKISSTSPVGRALLNRSEGEEVSVAVPAGEMRFRIEEIVN